MGDDGRTELEAMSTTLSDVEQSMVREARAWVGSGGSWGDAALAPLTAATRRAIEVALRVPQVAAAFDRGTEVLLDGVRAAAWAAPDVRSDAAAGPMSADERVALLATADRRGEQIGREAARQLAARGALTGAVSVNTVAALAALATDVTTMTVAQLRAIGEVLAGYGVEDLGATSLATVVLAGETDADRRRVGLLSAAGFEPGRTALDSDLEEVLAEQVGARVATDVVERLLRQRVRQRALALVPVVGAAAGAATAAWMTGRACDAARHVGRLRLLRVHASLEASAVGW